MDDDTYANLQILSLKPDKRRYTSIYIVSNCCRFNHVTCEVSSSDNKISKRSHKQRPNSSN